jgi:hypothetical protein
MGEDVSSYEVSAGATIGDNGFVARSVAAPAEIQNREKLPKSSRCGSKSPVSGAARDAN